LKRLIVLVWCILMASSGFSQVVHIDEIQNPTGGAITRLKTAPDGRLWVFAPGTLLAQTSVSPTAPLQIVDSISVLNAFDTPNVSGKVAFLGGFFPENGSVVTLSPTHMYDTGKGLGFKNLDVQASIIAPVGVQNLCSDYTVGAGQTLLPNLPGSFPASDGTRYFVGNDSVTSTVFLRGKPNAKGVCSLSLVATLDVPALQAWKQVDGSFLAQLLLTVVPNVGITSEIATVRNGTISRLVSTNPANSPARMAGTCCDLISDWFHDQSLVTYKGTGGDGGHAFVFKDRVIIPVYDNDGEGLVNDRIFGYDLNGSWAVIGGWSAVDGIKGFRLLLINVATRQRWVLAQTSDESPTPQHPLGNHVPSAVTIRSDGVVYFSLLSSAGTIFVASIPGVTGIVPEPVIASFSADNPKIVKGGSAKLLWTTVGATSATIDQNVGAVSTSGSVAVTPTVSTTYTLTASGPGGIVTSTVTVTVTPAVLVPTFTADAVVNAGSYKPPITSGSLATIFGSNLATSIAEATGTPLPTNLAGTQVLVNGVAAPLIYVSPGQINFQVPLGLVDTATIQAVTAQAVSAIVTVPLANAPGLFTSQGYIIAQNPSTGALVGQVGNPVVAGDVITFYGTGFGPTNCSDIKTGEVTPSEICSTKETPKVIFGGQPATVTYSGLVPGGIGYHQLNIIVPGVPPADMNQATSLSVTITVSLSNQKDYSAFVQVLQ
jgi:uncharacterized protein (TIGR03437 family)